MPHIYKPSVQATRAPASPAEAVPAHVAIIMDGNGRWANKRFLPRIAGHRVGVEAVRGVVKACTRKGIRALTLFAFSSENWRRPAREVGLLMDLLQLSLKREVKSLHENNVRLKFIGDRSLFKESLIRKMAGAEALTADNGGLTLVIAINYGGRWDVVQAMQKIARDVAEGTLSVPEVDAELLESRLSLRDLPEPDLFIRTGGEQRISNFLLWHLAYTELYFTDTLWPDFDDHAFEQALDSFAARQRRFGCTGEQIERVQGA